MTRTLTPAAFAPFRLSRAVMGILGAFATSCAGSSDHDATKDAAQDGLPGPNGGASMEASIPIEDSGTLSDASSGRDGSSAPADGGTLPTSRDPLRWPFSTQSIWNMPLHRDAQHVAAGIDKLGHLYTDDDVIIMAPGAPLTDVQENFKDWSTPQAGARCPDEGSLLGRLPIPRDLIIPHEQGTPNMSAAVLNADGRTLHQSQPFHRCSAGSFATSHYVFPSDDIITGDGIPGAHGGSAMSSLGGTLRMGELVPGGVIRHAIKIGVHGSYLAYNDDGSRGHRWPAAVADSAAASCYTGSIPDFEMGALLALKPDFAVAGLSTEPGRILARAFQDYGGYVTDIVNCGGPESWWGTVVMTEWGNAGRVRDEFQEAWGYPFNGDAGSNPWLSDVAKIFTSLFVIKNNAPTSIGGGVTDAEGRRAPLAPCIAGYDCP